jgi:hypothetical protein
MILKSTEIKENLQRLISETEDEEILGKVHSYLTTLQSSNIDWWELTTVQEKETIYESIGQLKDGKGISHNEVKKKADKLLGRK